MAIVQFLRAAGCTSLAGALLFASAPTATADDVRDKQWALKSLQAETAWKTTQGAGQKVAVIDDGVRSDHIDLKGNVLEGRDFTGGDGSAEPEPGKNHGTSMAALIAGHGHGPGNRDGVKGLAPEAKILPLKDEGNTSTGFASSIRYAVSKGATVINISKGDSRPPSVEEEKAIAHAVNHEVPVVASTGNEAADEVNYPAATDGVVAVGATKKDDSIWEKSNYGPEALLTAPGKRILSAGAGSASSYGIANGTSDATAYTSAALALVRSEFPDLTVGQLVNRLTKSAKLPPSTKSRELPDSRYGYGTIRPMAALTEEIPKGSKYGPLSAPRFADTGSPSEDELNTANEESDRRAVMIWSALGGVVVALVAVVLLIVFVVRRKKKNQNNVPHEPNWPGDPHAPGAIDQQPGAYPSAPQQPPRS